MFMDVGDDDYRLQWGSPCIDAADPDYDGDLIELDPDDLDPDGTQMDIGAFWFNRDDYIFGCTDPIGSNFNPDADLLDPESCDYPPEIYLSLGEVNSSDGTFN